MAKKYVNPTKVVTGECRFSYANLWEAKAMDENSKPKYSVSLIIPKSDTKTIAKIKALAHRVYVTEIKQLGRDLKITLYEKAQLNPAGMPALFQKYRRGLQFKNEQEVKFILTPEGKVLDSLTEFLLALEKMVEE